VVIVLNSSLLTETVSPVLNELSPETI